MKASITLTNGAKLDVEGSVQDIADLVTKLEPPKVTFVNVPPQTFDTNKDFSEEIRKAVERLKERPQTVPHWPYHAERYDPYKHDPFVIYCDNK